MKFIYDSVEYRLSFRHSNGVTIAFLEPVDGDPFMDGAIEASAKCSTKDRFVKETGRKIAITRLVARFEKKFRAAVWKAYFDRKNPQAKKLEAAA